MGTNVTHVVRQYLPSVGGMEEVVRNIAMHQARSGQHGTRIITLNRLFRNAKNILPEREEINGIDVIRLPYFGSSRYPVCPGILRHLGAADVVHVHGVDFFYDFLAATKWLHRRPLVLSTHGGFFHTNFASRAKETYFKTITRLSSHAYSQVVATSANDGEIFSRIMSKPKLQVIENGVDVEKYSDQAAPTLQPTLIYFGRWSANKGLLAALELFSRLNARDTRWHFIIAGREYDHTLAELQSRVGALGLQNHVQLVANPSDEALRNLLQQASYFLCLSEHEGFGIAPIEGMSAGLTPILSDIGPFKRLVELAQLGFTIPDTQGADTTIDKLLALHERGERYYSERRQAAMHFAARYAWADVADRYLNLYDTVGGRR
jgi:alpha-1,3-mannosyltransferase